MQRQMILSFTCKQFSKFLKSGTNMSLIFSSHSFNHVLLNLFHLLISSLVKSMNLQSLLTKFLKCVASSTGSYPIYNPFPMLQYRCLGFVLMTQRRSERSTHFPRPLSLECQENNKFLFFYYVGKERAEVVLFNQLLVTVVEIPYAPLDCQRFSLLLSSAVRFPLHTLCMIILRIFSTQHTFPMMTSQGFAYVSFLSPKPFLAADFLSKKEVTLPGVHMTMQTHPFFFFHKSPCGATGASSMPFKGTEMVWKERAFSSQAHCTSFLCPANAASCFCNKPNDLRKPGRKHTGWWTCVKLLQK